MILNDPDNDGVDVSCDNCPEIANPDQTDANNNNVGDVCEEGCLENWKVGIPCNPIHGACSDPETGYHFKGVFSNGGQNWACWWHTKNQGWMNNTINFWHLADHFDLEKNGGSKWCYPFAMNPCDSGACSFSNGSYFNIDNPHAWGWCGGAPFASGGFVCLPAGNKKACP